MMGRFDAPFWAALVVGFVLVGSLTLFGLAAAADAAPADGVILSVDDS